MLIAGRSTAHASAQRFHQVNYVFTFWSLLRHDRLAGALLIDELDQRAFILVLELVGLEVPALLIHDVPGQIEHVLCHFDVLDIVEILLLTSHFVGISQQRAHQALI
jgi:hypothetical protein